MAYVGDDVMEAVTPNRFLIVHYNRDADMQVNDSCEYTCTRKRQVQVQAIFQHF